MGTPLESRADQAAAVVDRLEEAYPDSTISLRFSNRLELLIAVVLSAQCTDERVNAETEALFETYQSAADYAAASQDDLADALDSITFYNNKAEYIREACQRIEAEHDGEVPDTMSDLTDLPGVGRKTANVVLQHGHDVVEGIVVDTHVKRLAQRLGVTEETTPEAIETDLMAVVPEGSWVQWTHLLIDHGRAVCTARNPDCEACVLADICPSSKLQHDVDLAHDERWDER
jgi:endonuclease-3